MLGKLESPGSLAEQAYHRIRDAIVLGELASGTRVTERGLAADLSVSATPVRDALRRLENEGLLERSGPRTLVVAEAPPPTAQQQGEVEAGLRGLIVRYAADRATEEQLDVLDRLLDQADERAVQIMRRRETGLDVSHHVDALLAALRTFDAQLAAACGNPLLPRLLTEVRALSHDERVRRTLDRLDDPAFGAEERYLEHRQLVSVLRARDGDGAERLVRRHAMDALAHLSVDKASAEA